MILMVNRDASLFLSLSLWSYVCQVAFCLPCTLQLVKLSASVACSEFHVKRGCVQENGNVGDRHRLVTYLQKIWHPFIAISYSRKGKVPFPCSECFEIPRNSRTDRPEAWYSGRR
ncbi:hypothetical protein KP509_12G076800 [Ceratopteris richardii]|uniref:Uncharacterized protein n=1 Tax=Ceratopteris richardii TaxID=49495 RepID=A0A8T2TMC9_CERRI|nr:hypothetical protein KP509_12G076800 [Ceratopteris richardii]